MRSSTIEKLKSVFSFFTTIPVKGDIKLAAGSLYTLPLVSFIIVLPAATAKYLLDMRLPPSLASIISISLLYALTGIIHLDGLSDMFDGIAKQGNAEQKIKAMKDINSGVAGTAAMIFVILTETFALSEIKGSFLLIISFFLTAELSAKLSMLTVLAFGNFRGGLGMMFKDSFKTSHFFYYLLISLIFVFLIRYYWFMVVAGFAIGYIISKISKIYFGGASGDVVGAANELSRAITMLLMCLVY
ncbi:MAG: adenosylcobinamide-GDP ribazoletransferase [Conexivisphaerales archaeon]